MKPRFFPLIPARLALACLAALVIMPLFTLSCGDDSSESIPIEITSITPVNGSTISSGTHFTVNIDYTIPTYQSDIGYEVSVHFMVDGGGGMGGAAKTVTAIKGAVTIEFDFASSSYMEYPYQLKAYLSEVHPDYGYIIESTGPRTYY